MPAISAFCTSIPRYRLPRSVIAEQWGGHALPGERTVASFDEDSLTLAVDASLGLVGGAAKGIDGVFFVSTTSPYREKLVAATLAAVLDAPPSVRALDFGDTQRAAAGALFTAFDLVRAGSARRILVAAGEVSRAQPDSMDEQNCGDAGAAVLVSDEPGGVELVAHATLTEEFHSTWRTDTQDYPHSFPGALDARFGYGRMLPQVLGEVLREAKVAPDRIARAVLPGNPRSAQRAAASVGLDPRKQLQDSLWMGVGETGAAQPLLLLAAALETAKPGDLILWAAYGDGADAALFRVGERIASLKPARSVEQQIEIKRPLRHYGKYARWRDLVKRSYPSLESSSAAVLFRDRKAMLPLQGGRCPKCATLQFPINRICIQCGYSEGLQAEPLPRRGKVFTFYQNHVVPHPDSPVLEAVIQLEGDVRFFAQVTDCAPDELEIDTPVELVFRRHHDAGGIHNYFWKARPL